MSPGCGPYALAFGLAAAGSAGAFLLARPIRWADQRPMPQPVRLSFGAFSIILIGAGIALLAHAGIFPWQLGAETSVMFGLIFLGAATYFICGVLDPHWGNAVGQLAGFLAYDLVLLAPFLARFNTASGGSLVSLIIYIAFLVYSGALASYYLFASDKTRISPRLKPPSAADLRIPRPVTAPPRRARATRSGPRAPAPHHVRHHRFSRRAEPAGERHDIRLPQRADGRRRGSPTQSVMSRYDRSTQDEFRTPAMITDIYRRHVSVPK